MSVCVPQIGVIRVHFESGENPKKKSLVVISKLSQRCLGGDVIPVVADNLNFI